MSYPPYKRMAHAVQAIMILIMPCSVNQRSSLHSHACGQNSPVLSGTRQHKCWSMVVFKMWMLPNLEGPFHAINMIGSANHSCFVRGIQFCNRNVFHVSFCRYSFNLVEALVAAAFILYGVVYVDVRKVFGTRIMVPVNLYWTARVPALPVYLHCSCTCTARVPTLPVYLHC